jgi:HEAT repeats
VLSKVQIKDNDQILHKVILVISIAGSLFLVGVLTFYLSLEILISPKTLSSPGVIPSTLLQREVNSWLDEYSDLSQAMTRSKAFQDLTKILQQNKDAPKEIEKVVLLNKQSSIESLALVLGALSSQGTPEAQRVLCNALWEFAEFDEKIMLLFPQIMLIEEPQDFLFDELQNFVHKNHNSLLLENARLTLAGLSKKSDKFNKKLALKITFWLQQERRSLSDNPQEITQYLDLLGNSGNESFLSYILQASKHENFEVRSRAAFALRSFKGKQVVSTLEKLASDKYPLVRSKAIEALKYFYLNGTSSNSLNR